NLKLKVQASRSLVLSLVSRVCSSSLWRGHASLICLTLHRSCRSLLSRLGVFSSSLSCSGLSSLPLSSSSLCGPISPGVSCMPPFVPTRVSSGVLYVLLSDLLIWCLLPLHRVFSSLYSVHSALSPYFVVSLVSWVFFS
ncbi:hypothetical protein NHX12_003089, partial [Muraenolepis orangiensis]